MISNTPVFAMGCWQFGGEYWQSGSRNTQRSILKAALKAGITSFDTAPAYGNGESEQVLGQLLHKEVF